MFQSNIVNRLLPNLTKTFWLKQVKKFSNSSIKDDNNTSQAEENVEHSLKDNAERSLKDNAENSLKDNAENSLKDNAENSLKDNAENALKNDVEYPDNSEEVSQLLQQSATFSEINDKQWKTGPYPADIPIPEAHSRPSINPKETCVILFPGQGTLKVGMAKQYLHFPAAKELFDIANEILNYDLLKICLDGPEEKLNRTEFNQAATVVSSLAALEKVREERPAVFDTCVATAGYSVGEITALILSGAISFEDGVRLVCIRGKAMQSASNLVPQGMLSIICTPKAKLSKALKDAEQWAMDSGVEYPVCRTAIYLHTERKILAGNVEALEYIEKHQKTYGLRNANRLPVSGAFHTPLMEPALKSVSKMLHSIDLNDFRCKVYSNYKGDVYYNKKTITNYLLKQIIYPVKWEQCIHKIYSRPLETAFPRTFDVGSQGRMKTILKLINAKAWDSCISV